MKHFAELSQIGLNHTTGGIDRQLGSIGDKNARIWLKRIWKNEMHLNIYIDPIANLWGSYSRHLENKPIVFGSHHDSVADGGKYDGAMGVIIAMEVIQTIKENHIIMRHPLEIVSFTGEEPNSYLVSTLGSKVLCGRLNKDDIFKLSDKNTGQLLSKTIDLLGGNSQKIDSARLDKKLMTAFLEFHIEQGRCLFNQQQSVAAVTCITGIYREIITVIGEANHAGTTHLENRKDALCAAAQLCLDIENIMNECSHLAITVGKLKVKPGAASVIPGRVILTIDMRTVYPAEKEKALVLLQKIVTKISQVRGVRIERKINLDQLEMPMDSNVINAMADAFVKNEQPVIKMVSMAGHDAANMARLTKAGMLFAQSVDGYSHCPREYTAPKDIVIAAQVYLDTLLILDKELE
nr:hydantoinase/carbamoylase family amidase [Pectinatus sottacetonis]